METRGPKEEEKKSAGREIGPEKVEEYKKQLGKELEQGFLASLRSCNLSGDKKKLVAFANEKLGETEYRERLFKIYLLLLFPMNKAFYDDTWENMIKLVSIFFFDPAGY